MACRQACVVCVAFACYCAYFPEVVFCEACRRDFAIVVVGCNDSFVADRFYGYRQVELVSSPAIVVREGRGHAVVFSLIRCFERSIRVSQYRVVQDCFDHALRDRVYRRVVLYQVCVGELGRYERVVPNVDRLVVVPFSGVVVSFFYEGVVLYVVADQGGAIYRLVDYVCVVVGGLETFTSVGAVDIDVVLREPFACV